MARTRVAICDRCFRRGDISDRVNNQGLPNNWAKVTAEWFDHNGYGKTRIQDWCPSCAGNLHNLFLLGYTVVPEAKDETPKKEAE